MILPRIILACALAFILGGASALPGSGGSQDPPSPTLESLRARWERFTPEQKVRARARYEQYLAMSEEERVQLAASAQALRQRVDRVQEELQASAPARAADLEPEKRRTIAREIVAEQSREIGARIRTQVPGQWIERIRNAPPEERVRLLRQFQIHQRDRVARYAIGELGRRLELRQRLSAREVHGHGLPPGITPEQWEAWLALSPEDFFEEFQRYWWSRVESLAAEKERAGALRELLEAARPRVEEAVALAELTPQERGARMAQAKRARCVRVIRERELLSPAEIEALEAKDNHEFFEGVRKLLRPRTERR